MKGLSIGMVFVVGLVVVAILAYIGIGSEIKARQKKQADKKVNSIDSDLDKLIEELKKLASNKKKTINTLAKDVQVIRSKAEKIRDIKALNVGHGEKLWEIDARLSRLERKNKS